MNQQLRWARVEYQADLSRPAEPVPLGVIVTATLPHGLVGVVVLGREPNPHDPPSELKDVGALGMAQLVGWVRAVGQEIDQAQREQKDYFLSLYSRWRWNLYVSEAEEYIGSSRSPLLDLAHCLYSEHVKEPFPVGAVPQKPPTRLIAEEHHIWSPATMQYEMPIPSLPPDVDTSSMASR